MEEYEVTGLQQLREADTRFLGLSDSQLRQLYRTWSLDYGCAGWIAPSPNGIAVFIEWAFTTPFEEVKKTPL